MRLKCPNCDAQYEVPDEVIPPEGRDVQCSNCGHTWFQVHPDHPEAAGAAAADEGAAPSEDADGDWEEGEAAADEGAAPARAEDWPARRRSIEPDVSEILREEAEREARLRAREAESLESQPDLGLGMAAEAEARKARLRGQQPPEAKGAAETGSRRDLLPDIEDINASLGGAGARTTGTELGPLREELAGQEEEKRGGGFLRGFAVAILIGVVLTLAYSRSQEISHAVPQAGPLLDGYVGVVDAARLWLESQSRALMAQP